MKKTLLAIAALTALTSGAAMAQQQDGNWMVRVRAVHLDSANKDSTGLGLSINNKTMPEFDISYFFTPNIAAELILTYPQKHDVRSSALGGKIGTLKHLPPTLLAQYHFTNFGAFKPYVGAGINYTRFSSVDIADGAADVKRNSWGGALQVGFDYALDKNWSINFDVKKLYLKTDVSLAGSKIGTLKVDPVLVGVGVGYRF
ncbi:MULTISPECIES: OmpW/AlkL family protein [Comamonas]|jgi:outer membrane protein|uniref:OmpW family protein n=1 Tax=Comamonas terrigena TaxID=32013 RepID=A0A2A7UV74_COMTR|nr:MULTISPECIES: OmpW family outer membrane protein [Comamonas]MBP7353642.1 OmpW family protein [Comamonas sp.]MDH1293547.1 outer membrane beta-barrel protein [Comamonas terrigena]PEH89215.1 OmpW family protein [Comamonas terrigena]SUY72067.1 Outer membrane protein W precursor [Comamonas terrigena]BBL24335.1 outer membrane protein [Comamonas terrigena NBRC 13299]